LAPPWSFAILSNVNVYHNGPTLFLIIRLEWPVIMKKQVTFLLAILLMVSLSACKNEASLQTQASAKQELVVDEYAVFVDFKLKGEDQKKLMAEFLKKTETFVAWAHQGFSKDQLAGENINLQPVYAYPENQPRHIVAYQVNQRFKISALSFEQYNKLLPELPAFNAQSFGQAGVKVSEQQASLTRQKLASDAFAKNQQKANHLAQLSGLCKLEVLEVKEFDQGGAQPRMMMMKSKEGAQAPSKQTLSVRLDINWRAESC